MQLLYVLLLGLSAVLPSAAISFTSPPPAPENSVGNYSLDAIYLIGAPLIIEWTLGDGDAGKDISITLSQDLPGDVFEYVFQNQIDSPTSYSWTVETSKDLTKTSAFFMQIFFTGSTSEDATSHYFNITSKALQASTSTSSTTSSTLSSSSLSRSSSSSSSPSSSSLSSTATSTGTSTGTSTSASATGSGTSSTTSSGLSSGAKAGVGVGVAAVVVFGLIGAFVAWLILGRRKKQDESVVLTQIGAQYPDKGNQEAPLHQSELGPGAVYTSGNFELPASNSYHGGY